MDPVTFYKCLADESRLNLLLIIQQAGEACVCDLMIALALDQPRTSRHLRDLRKCGLVSDDRRGKWVYYRLNPALPEWAKTVLSTTYTANKSRISKALQCLDPKSCC